MRTLILLIALSSPASAASLRVEASSPNVTVETFEFRRVATRSWLGCWHWDVLQGTGWFRATWHHLVELVAGSAELPYGWYEWYCDARIDQYNAVRFTWTDPADAARVYRGSFMIEPGSVATDDVVGCELVAPADEWNHITCTAAHVALDEADVEIRLELLDLE